MEYFHLRQHRIPFQVWTPRLNSQILLSVIIGLTGNLVTQTVVFAGKTLTLLLQGLNVTVLRIELLLQTSDLAGVSSLGKAGRILSTSLLVALEDLDLVFKAKNLKDHGVGAVEDKRQEKGEAAEVHVTLRVELPGLDFHAVSAEGSRSIGKKYGQICLVHKKCIEVGQITYPMFSLEKLVTSSWTRYTRFTLSMKRIKMKMNVI